jgi:hypothetical protein
MMVEVMIGKTMLTSRRAAMRPTPTATIVLGPPCGEWLEQQLGWEHSMRRLPVSRSLTGSS